MQQPSQQPSQQPPQPPQQPAYNFLKQVVMNRVTFEQALQYNSSIGKHTLIKLTATWCGPCKTIKTLTIQRVSMLPQSIECYEVDVDASSDMYAYLKQRRMVNGIPAFLFYNAGNVSVAPDDSLTGAHIPSVNLFFDRCMKK
jgi:thiol:disulfide interchange protein